MLISRREIAEYLGLKTLYHVTKAYINPLVKSNQLFMTIPEHPMSKNQKFCSLKQ
ncbi:Fic family protein [Anaerovoracaceae bacterium Sow4_D4]